MRDQVNLLVNNLDLLGITRARPEFVITTRTFTALENHKKAAELIFYQLLKILNGQLCKERLGRLYPCDDSLKAKEFRNAVFRWLSDLKRDRVLGASTVRRSLLDDCAGERYEDLLLSLSSYVYKARCQNIARNSVPSRRSIQIALNPDSSLETLEVHNLIQSYRLSKLSEARNLALSSYHAFAAKLVEFDSSVTAHDTVRESSATQDIQAELENEMHRIKNACSSTDWITLIAPSTAKLDSFFVQVPWKPDTSPPHDTRRGLCVEDIRHHRADIVKRMSARRARRKTQDHATTKECTPVQTRNENKHQNDEKSVVQARTVKVEWTGFKPLLDTLYQDLASLEPQHQALLSSSTTVSEEQELEQLRQLTPVKPKPSLLPRRQTRPQDTMQKASSLLRTVLRNTTVDKLRVERDVESPLKQQKQQVPPVTPRRDTTQSFTPTSTVTSINRLIDLLQDGSDTSPTPSKPRSVFQTVPYRGTNRALEQSFSLWDTNDNSSLF